MVSRLADGGSRRRRRALLVTAVLTAAVVAFVLVGVALYVYPPRDRLGDPGVIEVLGPASPERIAAAQRLHDEYGAPLLISVAPRDGDGFSKSMVTACRDAWTTCATPVPFQTRGEARLLDEYTRTHPVATAVVVTFTPQVSRARFIFAKCYPGRVAVVAVDEHLSPIDWAYQFLYQSAAFVKAMVVPCPALAR